MELHRFVSELFLKRVRHDAFPRWRSGVNHGAKYVSGFARPRPDVTVNQVGGGMALFWRGW